MPRQTALRAPSSPSSPRCSRSCGLTLSTAGPPRPPATDRPPDRRPADAAHRKAKPDRQGRPDPEGGTGALHQRRVQPGAEGLSGQAPGPLLQRGPHGAGPPDHAGRRPAADGSRPGRHPGRLQPARRRRRRDRRRSSTRSATRTPRPTSRSSAPTTASPPARPRTAASRSSTRTATPARCLRTTRAGPWRPRSTSTPSPPPARTARSSWCRATDNSLDEPRHRGRHRGGARRRSSSRTPTACPARTPTSSAFDHYYDHPGVAVTASTGDFGNVTNWPASNPNVVAVGGTTLTSDSSPRGWTESAWADGGSGCSPYEPKPDFQQGLATDCDNRAIADISADADPDTGLAVFDTPRPGRLAAGRAAPASLAAHRRDVRPRRRPGRRHLPELLPLRRHRRPLRRHRRLRRRLRQRAVQRRSRLGRPDRSGHARTASSALTTGPHGTSPAP